MRFRAAIHQMVTIDEHGVRQYSPEYHGVRGRHIGGYEVEIDERSHTEDGRPATRIQLVYELAPCDYFNCFEHWYLVYSVDVGGEVSRSATLFREETRKEDRLYVCCLEGINLWHWFVGGLEIQITPDRWLRLLALSDNY